MPSKSQWGQLSCPRAETALKLPSALPEVYPAVLAWLAANPKGKVAGRTFAYRRDDGTIDIKLYDTVIVSYRPDGSIVLNAGGFRTQTTKALINLLLPKGWHVWTERGVWYVSTRKNEWSNVVEPGTVAFTDGMVLAPTGTWANAETPEAGEKRAKDVAKYVHKYIAALFAGDIPKPEVGEVDTGEILTYVRNKQIVPALIEYALAEHAVPGRVDMRVLDTLWGGISPEERSQDTIRRSLQPPPVLPAHAVAQARKEFTVSLRKFIKSHVGLTATR